MLDTSTSTFRAYLRRYSYVYIRTYYWNSELNFFIHMDVQKFLEIKKSFSSFNMKYSYPRRLGIRMNENFRKLLYALGPANDVAASIWSGLATISVTYYNDCETPSKMLKSHCEDLFTICYTHKTKILDRNWKTADTLWINAAMTKIEQRNF